MMDFLEVDPWMVVCCQASLKYKHTIKIIGKYTQQDTAFTYPSLKLQELLFGHLGAAKKRKSMSQNTKIFLKAVGALRSIIAIYII